MHICHALSLIILDFLINRTVGFLCWEGQNCDLSNRACYPDVNVTICTLIESGNRNFIVDYNRIAAALDIAVMHANDMIVPKGFRIVRMHKNNTGFCAPKTLALRRFFEWYAAGDKCDVYIGPGCTEAVLDIYKAVEFQEKVVFGIPGPGLTARTGLQRSDFPYLIRTTYIASSIGRTIVRFLDAFKYSHMYLIIDKDDSFYLELGENFIYYLRGTRMDVYNQISTSFLSRNSTGNDTLYSQITDSLRSANTSARVIVLLVNADTMRKALVTASDLGMVNGQYVYFGAELFASRTWGRFSWERGDEFDSTVKRAFKSLILISIARTYQGDSFEDFEQAVRKLALKSYNYRYGIFDQVDPVVMGYYDAVILFSTIIKQLYDSNLPILDVRNQLNWLKNTSVLSPLQSFINISSSGDKKMLYDIKFFNEAQNSHDAFLRVDPDSDVIQVLISPKWHATANGTFPPDVPPCGYSGLECKVEPPNITMIAVVSIFVVLLVGGGIGGAVYYFLLKNRGMLQPNWWRYRLHELDLLDKAPSFNNGQSRLVSGTLASKITKSSYFNSVSAWKSALLQGTTIGVKNVVEKTFRPTPDIIAQMDQIQPIRHSNLQRFIGLCLDEVNWVVYIMAEFCQKGCLDDLLDQKSLAMDWSFKYSLISDVAEVFDGMFCLHSTPVVSHGYLTSLNCLIDGRLSVRICDYGITKLQDPKDVAPLGVEQKERDYTVLLWRAPELLKLPMPVRGTQKGDVYSFSIILQQVILRCGPYESPGNTAQLTDSPFELLCEVASGTSPPIRPPVPRAACSAELLALMENCWSEFPINRPTFLKIKETIRKISGFSGGNLVDHLLKRMEKYASDLEEQVAYKTQQFMDEKLRSEELLSQMLPKAVALSLVRGESVHPEFFEMVTVYFSDIVGFTNIAASGTPMDVISLLNDLYTQFDEIVEKHDAYKVETIGDAYMVASGLPIRNGTVHADEVASVALEILFRVKEIKIPQRPAEHLRIRSGMHSGSCVAGIIGIKAPRYCLFGDSINTASRMESTGEPMRIQTTESTKNLLNTSPQFRLEIRGQTEIKGKGLMTTYWLTTAQDRTATSPKRSARQ